MLPGGSGRTGKSRKNTRFTRNCRLSLLYLLGLDGGDCDYADDLFDAAASGQVIDRSREALEEAVGIGFADTLDQFVADVACLEVREDQYVCAARNG